MDDNSSTFKRINWPAVAIALTFAIQTGGAIWWASSKNTEIANMDDQLDSKSSIISVLENKMNDDRNNIARLEERIKNLEDNFRRFEWRSRRSGGQQ